MDPGIFVRGRGWWLGGGGVGGGRGQSDKKALTLFFFGQFLRNLSFFKVPEGVQHFPGGGGGGPTFSRGVQLLIPYRNPYNL